MTVTFVYLDGCSEAQYRAVLNEIHDVLGVADDPLDILIESEESPFDVDLACRYLNALHDKPKQTVKRIYERGCSYPQCYKPCRHCRR